MLRTHTCGELTARDAGKEVTLCGWVATRRDHGKLVFIDIRDRYGLTQVVFIPKESPEAHAQAEKLGSEFVIKVNGTVNRRPANTINPKLATGEIEVLAKELVILNESLTPPFEVEDSLEVTEEMRLKYRYLDMRRPAILEHFLLRHKAYQVIRTFMNDERFIECETPLLTKSTPEGARDYLVPSRLNPGQFYALPQSPQLFKQIFMVAGIDRYYQIAKCFRDEDLRADRQPEFTQLDLEMSFPEENDIFDIIERLMKRIFKELKGIELSLPFPRMSHAECLTQYNTDKPDTRTGNTPAFSFVWVKDFPLFNYNKEEQRWESEHHPFTAPAATDIARLEAEPGKALSRSYDLVLNGVELGSGSIRIHEQALQERIFKIIGIDAEQARTRFGFLLEAFQYGAPPHGGFAFGLDRLLALIAGEASIREVIAFPKTQKAFCPLTGAPSDVEERQLSELRLAIKKERK